MSKCWICVQKAAWKKEKKDAARQKAKDLANDSRETVAIIKEGVNYRVIKVSEAQGLKVLETISVLQ